MKTILFQGDSITDAGATCMNGAPLGTGYPLLIKSKLGMDEPNEYNFINLGISGNRVVDLYARIRRDFINRNPDYISILIGVNDVWHEYPHKNGVDAEKFEKIYTMLLEEIFAALPDVKILIMEPFCLAGSATTTKLEDGSDLYPVFRSEVEKRAEAAKRVAEKFGLPFLPLQKLLDEKAAESGASYWLVDGVHPTPMGHELITREWLKAFPFEK